MIPVLLIGFTLAAVLGILGAAIYGLCGSAAEGDICPECSKGDRLHESWCEYGEAGQFVGGHGQTWRTR